MWREKQYHLDTPHSNLKGLTIHKSVFTGRALLDVFQRNKETLKYIEMADIELSEGHWDAILDIITTMLPQLSVIRMDGLMYRRDERNFTTNQSFKIMQDKLPVESLRPKDLAAWFNLVDAVAQVREHGVLVKTCDFAKVGSATNRTVLHIKPYPWFSTKKKLGTTRCCGVVEDMTPYPTCSGRKRCTRLKWCLPDRRGRDGYWLCSEHVNQDVEDAENWPWGTIERNNDDCYYLCLRN